MPFPSLGCQTCKIRRIKVSFHNHDGNNQLTLYCQCDETQPVCSRCIKSNRACLGLRSSSPTPVFHLENAYASGARKRPRGPRTSRTPLKKLTNPYPSPQAPLLLDLKTQAVNYYINSNFQTLAEAPSLSKGIPYDVLQIWNLKGNCEILDLAVSSMALAVFSRTQHHPKAEIEAIRKHQQLLRLAQERFKSLDNENIDECLLAIFFMGRYEDAMHTPARLKPKVPFTKTLQSSSHHEGGLTMLKIWKEDLMGKAPVTGVIKHTRRGLIRSALIRSVALPEWSQDGACFGEGGLELEYDGVVVRLSGIRQRLSALLNVSPLRRSFPEFTSTVEELHIETTDLDRALQKLTTHFPKTWRYQIHTLPEPHPWPIRDFYSPIIYNYESPAYAAVWNTYFSTRMLINNTLLKILSLAPSPSTHSSQLLSCHSNLRLMANDLASSIPYCLERFSLDPSFAITLDTKEDIKPYLANLVVWPLTIASSLENLDRGQRQWFRSELARLGRVVGVGVIECAEMEEWMVL